MLNNLDTITVKSNLLTTSAVIARHEAIFWIDAKVFKIFPPIVYIDSCLAMTKPFSINHEDCFVPRNDSI